MREKINIGVIGAGSKRYKNVYRSILKKIEHVNVFCWNRTKNKLVNSFEKETIVSDIKEFCQKSLDIVICFLPSNANYDFINSIDLKLNKVLLIETPVLDTRWLDFKKFNVGVLEQWPYLPVELFKHEVYKSGIISLPHQIINDGRSFDYHAIAQMRSFCQNSMPDSAMGMVKTIESPPYIDLRGKKQNTLEEWTYGMSNLKNGVSLIHMFSYDCKLSVLKPVQLMRHCSVDGSIISGRVEEMENDYNFFKVTYLINNIPHIKSVDRITNTDNRKITEKIICKDIDVEWSNKFAIFGLNDHETAIAYMLYDADNLIFRKPLQSYVDSLIIHGFKMSAIQKQVINFN